MVTTCELKKVERRKGLSRGYLYDYVQGISEHSLTEIPHVGRHPYDPQVHILDQRDS